MASSNSWPPPDPVIVSPLTNPYPTYDPLLTPPAVAPSKLPKLPSGPRPQSSLPRALSSTHVLSTHIVTGAWPRCPGELFDPVKHEPPAGETKEQRKARVAREFNEMQAKKRAAERREPLPERKEVLYNVFNRYRRKGKWSQNGLTLLVTHAVGFPKEIWESTYARIIQQTESANPSVRVNEIWAFESVNHGDSALVNEGKLGFIHTWAESSRDLINFLLYYLPANPAVEDRELPLHLERLPESIAQSRRKNGFVGERTVVGIAHSAGAAATILSALWEPQLYHSLIVLEAIVMTIEANDHPIFHSWVRGAIGRRSKWSSREEVLKLYKAAPSFSYWDPEVLQTFIDYGITDDPETGGVKLKGPVILEAMAFSERQNGVHIYEMLKDLNPNIELRFIYSARTAESTGGEVSTRHVAHRRPVNTSNVRINASHLMVQESPAKVSKAIVEFLQNKYGPRPAPVTQVIESARL